MVVQLLAKDQDELNEPVKYAIDGSGSEYFTVDENTGMIKVGDARGMIRGTSYLFEARVSYKGTIQ